MRLGKVIHCVDAHAEGEPSRIVLGGVLDVPGETMLEKLRHLEREGDALRRLLLFEPRGSAPLSADLVLPASHPDADAGFIIMESCSYEGMSGTNTINTATVLLETGTLPLAEPVTRITLEAPAGLVRITADCARGRCERVTFENVPSFATHLDAPLTVEGLGELRVDVAYGGGFFAFVGAGAPRYSGGAGGGRVPERCAREAAGAQRRGRRAGARRGRAGRPSGRKLLAALRRAGVDAKSDRDRGARAPWRGSPDGRSRPGPGFAHHEARELVSGQSAGWTAHAPGGNRRL